jgi:aspartate-semialdehyde dehydrogenase
MAVTVGRLRPCGLLDWKFVVLSHNTIRGAAGATILNAELLASLGKLELGAPRDRSSSLESEPVAVAAARA